jgi:T5SS/PEP-CTERM-associated repeat protein
MKIKNLRPLPLPCCRFAITVAFCLLTVFSFANCGHAQTTWTDVSGGSWHLNANWSNGVPTSTEATNFTTEGTYDVTWLTDTSSGALEVDNANVLFKNSLGSNEHTVNGLLDLGTGSSVASTLTLDNFDMTAESLEIRGAATLLSRLNVESGAKFNSNSGTSNLFDVIGANSSNVGRVMVSGFGSEWNSSNRLRVGEYGTGYLDIINGGTVNTSNDGTWIGRYAGSYGSVFVGDGSFVNQGLLSVGRSGEGVLFIYNGGNVSNGIGYVGFGTGSVGTALVKDVGSRWDNDDLYIGGSSTAVGGVGSVSILNSGFVDVAGTTKVWSGSTLKIDGGWLETGSLVLESGSDFDFDSGKVTITDTIVVPDFFRVSSSSGTPELNLLSANVNLGSGNFIVGSSGNGELDMNFSSLASGDFYVGRFAGSNGDATLFDSTLDTSGDVIVGRYGEGSLLVSGASTINSADDGIIGRYSIGEGGVTIEDSSTWTIGDELIVGNSGTSSIGALNIKDNAVVSVGDRTSINSRSTVDMDGGRLEFGKIDVDSYSRINGSSGELAGNLELEGVNTVSSFVKTGLDTSEVVAENKGILYGSGFAGGSLANLVTGELRTLSSDFVRFAGTGNTNAGKINNFGGFTEFANDLTNQSGGEINNFGGVISFDSLINSAGGEINGRGQFIANSSWINQGEMRFSNGTADILGNMDILAGGVIITSGDGTTTFYDDVVHNGAEIRTAEGSNSVFFGDLSGAGAFTGAGDVLIEGGYSPGNSPGVINFDGTLRLGANSLTEIEIGGTSYAEFDRLEIGGDFYIEGMLSALVWDNYQLGFNEEFIFADVQGDVFGQFQNFGEGDLVGNFNGVDLFISYGAGDGNDVAFFSAVPEPGLGVVLFGFATLMGFRRRRV